MATIKKKRMGMQQFGGMAPYGNVTTYRAKLQTNAAGAALESDSAAALAIADKVYLELLPAGYIPDDAQLIISTALTASVTCSLGFEYADGVDSAEVPQDAAFFGAGIALSAVARIRATGAKAPVKLAKEAYLVMTIAGAANAKAGRVDVIVSGERAGPQ